MKKLIITAILGIFFAAVMSIAASADASGTCGDNVTWALDDSGTLTITGTGAMADYTKNSFAPWYNNLIKTVVVNEGVTHISEYAFRNARVDNVRLPDSLETIGSHAFYECLDLESITIPSGVTSIGNTAFSRCASLSNITIPTSVTSIGASAFANTKISSITIPSGVTSIGSGTFYDCQLLTTITLPDGLTTIGKQAFYECNGLTNITIPDSVTSIGEMAFWECDSLTDIIIPDGVTTIGEQAFWECDSLSSITIPAGVNIGANAFQYCGNHATSLTVNFGGTPTEWENLANKPVHENLTVDYTMAVSTKVTLTPATADYTGAENKPTITVKKGTYTLDENTDYTVSFSPTEVIDPGTYTVTITGKSPYSGTCTAEFKVTGIKITTTALPNGTVNNAYSQTLTCTGGTGAKTWEVVESSLPAGLTLNAETGRISGTPTTPGTYTFNVKVTDSETKIDIKQLTITISPQKYTIAIHNDGNGAVYASETSATAGTLIKLTVIPKPGFVLRSLDHTYEDIIMINGTFIMPAHDVIFTAVFETGNNNNYNVKPVPKPDPEILPASGVAIPLNFRATSTQNGNTARLRWSNFPYADKFTVFMTVDGVQTKLKDTKNNSLTVRGLKNGVTYRFMVTFTVGTWTSPESLAATATVTPYFKPLVSAKLSDGNIKLGWKSVPDAAGYIVYKLADGKLKQIAETTGTSALITNAASGKEYVFAVSAIINGEKTGVKKSDLIQITA